MLSSLVGRLRSTPSGRLRVAAASWLAIAVPAPAADRPDLASAFPREVKAVLDAACVRCHGAKDPEGDVSLHTLGPSPTAADLVVWQKVLQQVEDDLMPPEGEKQPTAAARQALVNWIKSALPAGGVAFDEHKPLRSSRGNCVDHDALFSAAAGPGNAAPGRVWRLSPRGYRLLARQIAAKMHARAPAYRRDGAAGRNGDFDSLEEVDAPWELGQRWNFSDYSFEHRIGESEIEAHLRFCKAIVETMNWDRIGSARDVIGAGKAASRDQARKVVEELCGRVLPVPAAPDDLDRYADFLLAQLTDFKPTEAIGRCLTAILCRPELLYRIEEAAAGRGIIDPAALVAGLTNTVTISSGMGWINTLYTGITGFKTHSIGHGQQDPETKLAGMEVLMLYRHHIAKQAAGILAQLQAVPEGEGTMLDNTLLVFASDCAETQHTSGANWPFAMVGTLGGKIKAGQYLSHPLGANANGNKPQGEIPIRQIDTRSDQANPAINALYCSLLHAAGQPRDAFNGGSIAKACGPLPELLS